MRRAIATYRQSGVKVAMPQLDALIAAKPDWPYFYEIKGQFLFESGSPAAAIPPLREAVRARPRRAADPDHAGSGSARHQ